MVRDEGGDRREQRAERVDEALGLLGVGKSDARNGCRTCSSNISTASFAIARVASWCRRASARRSGSGDPASSSRSPERSTSASSSV